MKISFQVGIWGLALLLSGGLMAEQTNLSLSQNWVTVKDEETGLQADFPHQPLELTFDIPFQNTPPTGQVHLYSVPTQKGLLVLSTFTSSEVNLEWLQKDQLYQFFERVLVPHFFFNPAVFQDQQTYTYQPTQMDGEKAASFQITYHDHGVVKRLEGVARIQGHHLYLYFYLASDKDFDQNMFQHFLNSVHLKERA